MFKLLRQHLTTVLVVLILASFTTAEVVQTYVIPLTPHGMQRLPQGNYEEVGKDDPAWENAGEFTVVLLRNTETGEELYAFQQGIKLWRKAPPVYRLMIGDYEGVTIIPAKK